MTNSRILIATVIALMASLLAGCGREDGRDDSDAAAAEIYTRLVLALGELDPGYVDAYYGSPDRLAEVKNAGRDLDTIEGEATAALERLAGIPASEGDETATLRRAYLKTQLGSMLARVAMLKGERLSFDDEAKALYDATPPRNTAEHFQKIIDQIDALIPGEGTVAARVEAFEKGFVIPPQRLPAVFEAAVAACRERTLGHIELPADESFEIEYVTDKPWSGYNWYKGGHHSLIQVNTDLPIFIQRAVDLGCHEGYPGHHTYAVLLETKLVEGRGWHEFSVYALFSPQSLIAEGSANYGIEMAFPGDERIEFEKSVLFPLAGLDPANADLYYALHGLKRQLSFAGNEAARGYLNGDMTREEAVDWLVKYTLVSRERAEQRTRFFDTYRSYVINYNLGKKLVREYIERNAPADAGPERRWEVFSSLLASPRLPSGLAEN